MIKSTDRIGSQNTRRRVINTAMRLFAKSGFDAVSLRTITAGAKVNVGAVNYHFGSKENLIRQVFRSLAEPVNRVRLAELDKYEAECGANAPDLNRVVHALIAPAVRSASDPTGGGFYLARLLVLTSALPKRFITTVLAEQYDVIFHRFVAALSRAMPGAPYEDVCWRYDFAIGSLLFVVGHFDGSKRMDRLTNGLCDTSDVERIVDELVAFVTAGVQAPSVTRRTQPKQRDAAKNVVRLKRASPAPGHDHL